MFNLGLSAEALDRRRGYICAGDAPAVMAGNWQQLWRIKRGLDEYPDFYDDLDWFIKKNISREQMDLKREMGLFTEPFNLAYCQHRTGRAIDYYSSNAFMRDCWEGLTSTVANAEEMQTSKDYPFLAANLDGMTKTAKGERCVIDAKFVGRIDDAMIQRFTAAGTHQATVMGVDHWALSVFVGNSKWELIEQEVDPLYQANLIARERDFWSWVEAGEEPEDTADAVAPPKPQPKLRTLIVPAGDSEFEMGRRYDLFRNNNWLVEAIGEMQTFIATDGAAKANAIARVALRDKLIPADVGVLEYGRFKASRAKSGAITMTVAPMPEENDV